MVVNLTKGQEVNLSKEHPGLSEVIVGLGWEAANRKVFNGSQKKGLLSDLLIDDVYFLLDIPINCNSFIFLLKNNKLQSWEDIIGRHHLQHHTGAVIHRGDNLIGSSGKSDDEQIMVNLNRLPQDYDRLVIVVNILLARESAQHFGQVRNAYVRLVNDKNNQELYRYNLTEDYDGYTAMIFSELYRHNGEWKFSAIGQGTNDNTVSDLAKRYRHQGEGGTYAI